MIRAGRIAPGWASAGILVAIAAASAACGGAPPLAPVSSVVVRATDLTPALEEAGLDARTAVRTAQGALTAAGLAVDDGARRGYRATVEVVAFSVLTGGESRSRAEVVVELQLDPSWASGPLERRSGRGTAPFAGPDRGAAWREALGAALGEAAQAAALDLRARQRSTEELVGDLSSADARTRERALRTLSARGARGTLPAIAGRIHDADPEVARAAVDALIAYRDPTSVPFLIEAAQAGSAATTIRLIPVLNEIGGADVEGYLLTLQSGHADRAVRQAAADALARPSRVAPPARAAKR